MVANVIKFVLHSAFPTCNANSPKGFYCGIVYTGVLRTAGVLILSCLIKLLHYDTLFLLSNGIIWWCERLYVLQVYLNERP
ncbi:hypothetical protein AB205_0077920 [Aquarana catesbeiana]|uniref:Uncharacterized protein n=1 Tax=Aquarana catesbeiana TaxID=8400 RepID=A0A2G9SAQ7_AQUCT|nr:hypothetical protein AB205_0077920 [Aquarana catesbeiana]